jgi:hypothetical protein
MKKNIHLYKTSHWKIQDSCKNRYTDGTQSPKYFSRNLIMKKMAFKPLRKKWDF